MKDRRQLMKQWLKAAIGGIQELKDFKGIVPSHAMAMEVREKMREDYNAALLQMLEDGEVVAGRSLNDTWMELKKEA